MASAAGAVGKCNAKPISNLKLPAGERGIGMKPQQVLSWAMLHI